MTIFKKFHGKSIAVPDEVTNPRTYVRRVTVGSVALVLMALMIMVSALMPAPYVVQSAGPTLNVLGQMDGHEVVSVAGKERENTDGELRMTTVAVQGSPGNPVYLSSVYAAWFDPQKAIVPVEAIYPDTEDAEGTELMNTVEMNSSQQEAIATALRKQGISYQKTIIVAGVRTDGPAHGVLEAGDQVLSMNGNTAENIADYVSMTSALPEGSTVTMEVKRGEENLTLEVPTVQQEGRTMMGIVLSPGFTFPVDVSFAVEGIGGPSAGLIFSLAIYDEMTPGDLTGGKKIAGTGTINEEGTVGPIGGIRQKLVGAHDAGASFFLAPADNCGEVTGHVPNGLQVVKVATLDDALKAVNTIAETGRIDSLPTCG